MHTSDPSRPEDGRIARRAKLFEAGEFPEKGLTVTPADLAKWAAAFTAPVPLLIEHGPSPLDLGDLVAVEASGAELFGTVRLRPEASALLDATGAYALSLGLAPDLSEIREVSLVRSPRVATARVFSEPTAYLGEGSLMPPGGDPVAGETVVERAIQEGRLVPAQVDAARALLAVRSPVAFGAGHRSVAELTAELIDRGLAHPMFTDLAPLGPGADPFSPDEAAFYARYFPELDPREIARRRTG